MRARADGRAADRRRGLADDLPGQRPGLLEAIQQLGMSLGIAIVGTVLLVAAGFLVAAFTVTWWLPRHAR